ncbi:low affinity iron permease family protein [Candidatus Obscuribacterales bacterium]|nr:low affinity iron permease family protein [Candidatus Obscuribacterales bacterium]
MNSITKAKVIDSDKVDGIDEAGEKSKDRKIKVKKQMAEDSAGSEKKKRDLFGSIAKRVAVRTGQPSTFLIAFGIIILWGITGPIFGFNDTWQLVINTGTTIVTFLMVFLIQNTQNRDSEAVQLKLDELIRAVGDAQNDVMDLEEKSQEELDDIKRKYSKLAKAAASELEERDAS